MTSQPRAVRLLRCLCIALPATSLRRHIRNRHPRRTRSRRARSTGRVRASRAWRTATRILHRLRFLARPGGTHTSFASARVHPGRHLEELLAKMQTYLSDRQGPQDGDHSLRRIVTSYLTSVLLPSKSDMGLRNTRELRTLAEALDLLIVGDIAGCGDLLSRRFKAVELASMEGNWNVARHLEGIAEGGVSATNIKERAYAAKLEKEELALKKLNSQFGTGGKRGS